MSVFFLKRVGEEEREREREKERVSFSNETVRREI